jgi:hypothetical protein
VKVAVGRHSPVPPSGRTISTHRASSLRLIHVKTSPADMDHSAIMKNEQNDAAATVDPRLRSALGAVARHAKSSIAQSINPTRPSPHIGRSRRE